MTAAQQEVCSFTELSKSYGRHAVLRRLSLSLLPGQTALLLGANGSGKTTLLRVCAGLCRPDAGAVRFADPLPLRLAYSSHQILLYAELTVRENIALFSQIIPDAKAVDAQLAEWGLEGRAQRRISELSKGEQARVSLCRAFIGEPRFIFLDEPTSSLDESTAELLLAKIRAQVERLRGTALIATHDVMRLKHYADRVLVLQEGSIAADLEELRRKMPDAPAESLKEDLIGRYLAKNR